MSSNIVTIDGDDDGERPHDDSHPGPIPPGASQGAKQQRQRRKGSTLSREDCLRILSQLPSLLAIRLMTPAQANAIRGVLNTILEQEYEHQPSRATAEVSDDLLQVFRQQPEMLRMMEPLLSDDLLEQILKGFGGD